VRDDSHDPARGPAQKTPNLRVVRGLQVEEPRDQLEAVLHPMINLLHKHLLALKRSLQTPLVALALNGHTQNVRCVVRGRIAERFNVERVVLAGRFRLEEQ
jgi:hypothetical protein